MKKNIILSIIGMLILLSFIGCKNESEQAPQQESKEGNMLIYASAADYTRINPALDEHAEIHKIIFRGLTKHDENGKIAMDMAKSIDASQDGMEYRISLREDALWHDGQPVRSNDVKFTIDAIKDPKNNSEIATNYAEIESVEVVDDHNLVIKMQRPCVAVLDYLSVGLLPSHLLEGKDIQTDGFNQNPIGNGAYKLSKWKMGQYIELTSFDGFYGTVPSIDKLIFKIVPDEKVRALQLKSGEVNLAQLEPKDAQIFENEENIKLYMDKTADYRAIMYNMDLEKFKSANLRKAYSYAIDKQEIIDAVLVGMGAQAYSPLQMGIYNNEDVEKYTYNPEKAKELIESEGYALNEDGIYEKDGELLEFRLTTMANDPVRLSMCKVAADQMKKIGIKVSVDPQENVDWGNLEAFLIGWGSPFDPDDHTYKVFHSDAIENGMNLNNYRNEMVDKYLLEGRTSTGDQERIDAYKNFQAELSKDPAFSFIAYIDAIYASNVEIEGIRPRVLGHHGVGFLWNVEEWKLNK